MAASFFLHAALFSVALFLSFGAGPGGGMPGNENGEGAGLREGHILCSLATLPGQETGGENLFFTDTVSEPDTASTPDSPLPEPSIQDKAEVRPQTVPLVTAKTRPKTKAASNTKEPPIRPGPSKTQKKPHNSPSSANAAATGAEQQSSAVVAGSGGSGAKAAGSGSGAQAGSGGGKRGIGSQEGFFGGRVDSKPKVLRRSKVAYPEAARRNKITGQVVLRFHLDEKGGISHLQIVKAEPPGIFEDAALAAIQNWRFAPAMKDGHPVPYWVELPMPFLLR